jgi:hypothetical protein
MHSTEKTEKVYLTPLVLLREQYMKHTPAVQAPTHKPATVNVRGNPGTFL